MVAMGSSVEAVIAQVKLWPAESRIALARRVLETLEGERLSPSSGTKGPPSRNVLGLWSPGGMAATDEECDEIIAAELSRKRGSQ